MDDARAAYERVLRAYAFALDSYDEAMQRFVAEPTGLNVVTLHRHLSNVQVLRDEIFRSQRLVEGIEGSSTEAKFIEFTERLARDTEVKWFGPDAGPEFNVRRDPPEAKAEGD